MFKTRVIILRQSVVFFLFIIRVSFDIVVYQDSLNLLQNSPGVYVIYDKQDKPIYIGKASYLKQRLTAHFKGHSHTRRFSHHFYKCAVINEKEPVKRDMCELYLIHTFDPPLNSSLTAPKGLKPRKVSYDNPTEVEVCKGLTKNGTKCGLRANTNGFCRYHGGNGITRSKVMLEAAKKAAEDYSKGVFSTTPLK